MGLGEFSESDVIVELAKIFATDDPRILLGIGDDAAVIAPSEVNSVITTDMAVEGVHFHKQWSSAFEIGRKITAANLADLLAMGATPSHLVAAISLTGDEPLAWIVELAQGMAHEARRCKAPIVGGDLVKGSVVTISMTAIGYVKNPILRSGAQVGDRLYVSNIPGWSAAGWHLLSHGINPESLTSSKHAKRGIQQFCAPEVSYEAARLMRNAHALIDISDGLMTQGAQMASASHVRCEFSAAKIEAIDEFADLAQLADEVNANVWDWVGAGGEDHVFLAAGKDLSGPCIGEVVSGDGIAIIGLEHVPQGFVHFN